DEAWMFTTFIGLMLMSIYDLSVADNPLTVDISEDAAIFETVRITSKMSAINCNKKDNESLQSIQKQIYQHKTDMLESSRNMVDLISESEEIVADTIIKLTRQKQLKNMNENVNTVDNTLIHTQKNKAKFRWKLPKIIHYFQHSSKSNINKDVSSERRQETAMLQMLKSEEENTYLGKSTSLMDDIEKETNDAFSK
ncbi:unnamed protein product, partial [Didymodactylos carnosus]